MSKGAAKKMMFSVSCALRVYCLSVFDDFLMNSIMDSVIMLHFFYIKGAKKSEISKFHFFFPSSNFNVCFFLVLA
jgi:hypothetical protein